MASKYVLNTHALIWYLEGNPRLGTAAKIAMDDVASEMVLPAIALAEALYIVDKGRTSITSASHLLTDVTADARIEVFPLTLEVLRQSLAATQIPEMHDRLITATALHLRAEGSNVAILTRDSELSAAAPVPTGMVVS